MNSAERVADVEVDAKASFVTRKAGASSRLVGACGGGSSRSVAETTCIRRLRPPLSPSVRTAATWSVGFTTHRIVNTYFQLTPASLPKHTLDDGCALRQVTKSRGANHVPSLTEIRMTSSARDDDEWGARAEAKGERVRKQFFLTPIPMSCPAACTCADKVKENLTPPALGMHLGLSFSLVRFVFLRTPAVSHSLMNRTQRGSVGGVIAIFAI